MALIIKLYLIAYNLVALILWSYLLYLVVNNFDFDSFQARGWRSKFFNGTFETLAIAQSVACLEIFNVLFGFVRSNLFSTFLQVASRLLIVWGVVYVVPEETQYSLGYFLVVISWNLVEIPRYLFYLFDQLNIKFSLLTWFRYSFFIVLYPTGVAGELLCFKSTLKTVYERSGYWTYVYYSYLFLMVLYIPGLPFMYSHMMKQRRNKLNPKEKKNQ